VTGTVNSYLLARKNWKNLRIIDDLVKILRDFDEKSGKGQGNVLSLKIALVDFQCLQ